MTRRTRQPAGGCRKKFITSCSPIQLSKKRWTMSEMQHTVQRPEFVHESVGTRAFGVVEKPLTLWERVSNQNIARKAFILILLAAIWQVYTSILDNPLLFPTFTATLSAFWVGIVRLGLLTLAALFTIIAISSRLGSDLLETLTSMFNPLPAIALLPLALLWFGLGNNSLIFVLIHSVLWPVSLNTHSGFMSVSNTLRMVGRNYGLTGFRYVGKILIPAAFPSILTGLKIGWAFAWRTLIAAELVFGVSSGSGGLGWFIFENRNQLEVANVFAGLTTVIIIGLVVESVIFRTIEIRTVRKWGMQR